MSEAKKIALVTGAAGTMGKAVAQGLIADGYRVVLADINKEALDQTAKELGSDSYPIAFDISDFGACKKAIDQVKAEVGDVDVLVNNAGILSNNKVAATTPEEWHKVLAVNLDGAFFLIQLCLPAMIEKKWGRIINTSSFASKSGGITAGTTYSVSKAAINGLTFSIAAETLKTGVTCNAIAPAYVRTPMVEKQLNDEQRAAVLAKIPVGRFCEPEEYAHAVRFLASPLSGFITGEVLDQNGGLQFD
ncbi:SDR family NAD(P)-dependent oxidoreductase [Marispirochaeta sp.]|jgi:3-oxoacyl-[acyl-carrier protein] reductase|uniref:SDR family NAD(P)-dependent oxidoreductase n=1 Tax=Marispirochaeta sp. TaxID=2038653 RepID=UPI0029C9926A|nr:SDR family NAD(P)-dependent oxidoreductase [Marispirochaeta sp.]